MLINTGTDPAGGWKECNIGTPKSATKTHYGSFWQKLGGGGKNISQLRLAQSLSQRRKNMQQSKDDILL